MRQHMSCSSERNWLRANNIMSKTKNCLALEQAKKLSNPQQQQQQGA